MSLTPLSTFGAHAAAELIAAKAAGRTFKRDDLAAFIDVLLHDWQQRTEPSLALTSQPAKIDAEAIYQAYPRKVGKKTALKAITAAIAQMVKDSISSTTTGMTPSESCSAYLLGRTQSYAAAVATWPERDQAFVPHPATWFNRGSYLDDPKEWLTKSVRTHSVSTRDYSRL